MASVSEQLRCRQPADPRADDDHVDRMGCVFQPMLGDLQQLLVVFVGETRELVCAQETHKKEDLEENWGEKKGREEYNAMEALGNEYRGSSLASWHVSGSTNWFQSRRCPNLKEEPSSRRVSLINWYDYET